MRLAMVIGCMALSAGAAFAQGASPTREDLTPAAPTQARGPDGAQTYKFPPSTDSILPAAPKNERELPRVSRPDPTAGKSDHP